MSAEEANSLPRTVPQRLREMIRNPISSAGVALALVALANIVFLFLIDLTSARPSPYIGILAYMVAPGFFIAGLALIVGGIWYDRRRRRSGESGKYFRIDFSDPTQRGTFAFFLSFVIVFI